MNSILKKFIDFKINEDIEGFEDEEPSWVGTNVINLTKDDLTTFMDDCQKWYLV